MVFVLNGILFSPPPAPKKDNEPEKNAAQEQVEEQPEDAAAGEPAENAEEAVNAEAEPLEPVADVPQQYVTIGSLDPSKPYRLLATLTNEGAGVRRVELSSPKYRDVHDRGGYLGNLELIAAPSGGLLVQAIGDGTPLSALPDLQVGDRLLSAKSGKRSQELKSPEDLQNFLSKLKPGKEITLEAASVDGPSQEFQLTLGRKPLETIRPEIENVRMRTDDVPAGLKSPASYLLTLNKLGNAELEDDEPELPSIELLNSNWEIVEQDQESVAFRQRLPKQGIEVIKRYRVAKNGDVESNDPDYPAYHLTLEIEIRNLGTEAASLAYRLDGPNGLPIEGWWYSNKVGREWTVGIRDYIIRQAGVNTPVQNGPQDVADGEVEPSVGKPLAYVGIDAQYFSSMMLPEKPAIDSSWIDESQAVLLSPKPRGRSTEGRFANVTCRLLSKSNTLAPGESFKHSYRLFNGPKRPELLQKYTVAKNPLYSLGDLEYYGWFSSVSRAMIAILHFFYGIAGNYGIAIIMLTVVVRLCLFPLSRKQAKSMVAMQALRPEMDKIKEKYKSDMQKQSQEMQELYRKHNINPLGGCLPMFVQLPIMMGLYRSLMVDVELRQAPLLGEGVRWCSNLAAPDMFFDWSAFMPDFISGGEGILGLGPYLNILPLVTIVLFIVQQKMFMPEAANEQAALQQKIMQYMMIFMGLLFFKVASGLCIYFITSSLWGIAERKLIPPPTAANGLNSAAETKTSSSGDGKSAVSERKAAAKSKQKAKRKKKR